MVLHTVEELLVGLMQDLQSKLVSGLDQTVRFNSDFNSSLGIHGVHLLFRGHLQLLFGASNIQSFRLFGEGTTLVMGVFICICNFHDGTIE